METARAYKGKTCAVFIGFVYNIVKVLFVLLLLVPLAPFGGNIPLARAGWVVLH